MELPKFEERITLNQLAQEEHKNLSTIWRWTRSGVGGHVLESFAVGRTRYTTRRAFARWVAARNGLEPSPQGPFRQQKNLAEQAERELDRKLEGRSPKMRRLGEGNGGNN
jgi:hypothetical protein